MNWFRRAKFRVHCWWFNICPVHLEPIMQIWVKKHTHWSKETVGCPSCYVDEIEQGLNSSFDKITNINIRLTEAKVLKEKIK